MEKIKKQIQEKEFSTQVKNEETSDNENDIEISIDKKPDTWASENESGSDSDSDTEENESDSMENDSKTEEKFVDKCGKTIKKEEKQSNKSLTPRPSDAEDGKTIFIRNVPFSCTNNDVRECFEKYGAVQYALICIDKLTEHSKGTAFVKYKVNFIFP